MSLIDVGDEDICKSSKSIFPSSTKSLYCFRIDSNSGVSAVLFCKTLKEFSLESAKLSLWHNPYVKFPVPQSLIPVTQFHYKRENKRLMRNENVVELDLLKVLDIDAGEYIRFKNLEYRQVSKADR